MLVEFMPGYVSSHGPHSHSCDEEVFVMEGELEAEGSPTFTAGCYAYKPAGTVQMPVRSPRGAIVYVLHAGPLDFGPVEAPTVAANVPA
jgi:hypothetical protein